MYGDDAAMVEVHPGCSLQRQSHGERRCWRRMGGLTRWTSVVVGLIEADGDCWDRSESQQILKI